MKWLFLLLHLSLLEGALYSRGMKELRGARNGVCQTGRYVECRRSPVWLVLLLVTDASEGDSGTILLGCTCDGAMVPKKNPIITGSGVNISQPGFV